jgi:hypothetical protein
MPEAPKNREQAEDAERVKKSELSDKQREYAHDEIGKALKEGIIRKADVGKIHAEMARLTPTQIANGEQILDEHLGKKRFKRDLFIKGSNDPDIQKSPFYKKGVDGGVVGVDEAINKGYINKAKRQQYIDRYQKLSGKDRAKEQEKMTKRIEMGEAVNQDVETIIQGSPHFFHNGEITPEGQALIDEHNSPNKTEGQKRLLRSRLVRKTTKLDAFAKLCDEREKTAYEHYQRGEYKQLADLMRKNERTCRRYPESVQLREKQEKSQRYWHNANYEALKNQGVNDKREEAQECIKDDKESAAKCASEAVVLMEGVIKNTYDGRQGPYQEGVSSEKARVSVTPAMQSMLTKVKREETEAKNVYETFKKEEEEQDRVALEGDIDTVITEETESSANKTRIDAALKTAENIGSTEKEEDNEQEPQNTLSRENHEQIPLNEHQEMNRADEEEDVDLRKSFVDEQANQEVLTEQGEEQGEGVDSSEVQQLSEDQLQEEKIRIDEKQTGKLTKEDADKYLRAKTSTASAEEENTDKVEYTENGRQFTSQGQVFKKLGEDLANSRIANIKKQQQVGKIKKENAEILIKEAQQVDAEQQGRDLDQEQKKGGNIIQFNQEDRTQSRLSKVFKRRIDPVKLMEEKAKKKAS